MRLDRLYILFCLLFSAAITGCASKGNNQEINNSNNQRVLAASETIETELGESRSLLPDFMCYNVNSVRVVDWQDNNFIAATNNLSPGRLRIPGGDVGNYWDWQRGGLIENIAGLPAGLPFFLRFKARQYNASKLSNFQAGLATTNTQPIFVLNMLTSDLESQLAMLREAQSLGMEIKYVELGNELYFNIPNYKKVFPNPRAYGLAAKEWAIAIKQEFPDAQIAVVGIVPSANKPPRLQNWNKVMRGTVLPAADVITLHTYYDHGLNSQKNQSKEYPYFEAEEANIILGEPFRNWQKLQRDRNYQVIPENKKIWITEYNLFEDIFKDGKDKPIPRVAGSWTHGLYNLATSLLFLEESRIESICNHSLIEGSIFGAVLDKEDSFVNPADPKMTATPMSLSATGSALSVLGKATQGMTSAAAIEFKNLSQLVGKDNFEYPAVYGWQFSNNTDKQAIIINLSSRKVEIDSSSFATNFNYQQLFADPKALINDPQVLNKTQGKGNNKITLPAYSVTNIY